LFAFQGAAHLRNGAVPGEAGNEEELGEDYAGLVGSQLLAVESDCVEQWLDDQEPDDPESDSQPAAIMAPPLAGATPLRGPLVQRAEFLRNKCIALLGDQLYGRALQILKTQPVCVLLLAGFQQRRRGFFKCPSHFLFLCLGRGR
jgi:hypothetical protein